MGSWYLPMTIVPGLGLLILSTSNLMVTLSNEIKAMISSSGSKDIISRKLSQLKLINLAMVFFYSSIAFLLVSALISGASKIQGISLYISKLAIFFAFLGLIILMFYSFRAVGIRQNQFSNQIDKFN